MIILSIAIIYYNTHILVFTTVIDRINEVSTFIITQPTINPSLPNIACSRSVASITPSYQCIALFSCIIVSLAFRLLINNLLGFTIPHTPTEFCIRDV
jgi:hypothetical protein